METFDTAVKGLARAVVFMLDYCESALTLHNFS